MKRYSCWKSRLSKTVLHKVVPALNCHRMMYLKMVKMVNFIYNSEKLIGRERETEREKARLEECDGAGLRRGWDSQSLTPSFQML